MLLDFVIVVVGIVIALQVQEWSNRQADRGRERQIIVDMLADLDIDRHQYANATAFAQRRLSAANASLIGAGLQPLEFEYELPSEDAISYAYGEVRSADAQAAELQSRLSAYLDAEW